MSPTLCVYALNSDMEYDVDAYMDSGANNVSISDEIETLVARMEATESSRIVVEDDEDRLSGFVLCDNKPDTEICFIQCMGRYFCRGTSVDVDDSGRTANLAEVNMICQGRSACTEGVSVDIVSGEIERFTLLCFDKLACEGVEISITAEHFRPVQVRILCDGQGGGEEVWSCKSMRVSLHVREGNVTIGCLKNAACESLSVVVDSAAKTCRCRTLSTAKTCRCRTLTRI